MTATDPAAEKLPANIFTIPAGVPFADALAAGLWRDYSHDPLALADVTLLLPTRRACRTVREAFLRLSDGQAVLLPRMAAVGDVDADDMALLYAGEDDVAGVLDLPPAIKPLERQILLARLIQSRDSAQSFDQAASLALALGRFLDEVQNEDVSLDALANLVPDQFASHWQQTLEFLRILTEHWPSIVAERGVMDAAARRTLLLRAQIAAWTAHPPQGRVIAAGTTGTTPAAADLLCLVARLPQGQLVLPGLDVLLDDAGWQAVDDDHPQSQLKMILSRAGVAREDVGIWGGPYDGINRARALWLSQAMRPAQTTDQWRQLREGDLGRDAVTGMVRVDCDTPQDEADLIALLMRETLETPEKTAALVTPDRRLARRVTQSLKRWGIQIDDTGGQPLTEIMAGSYLTLLADMAEQQLAPVTLLAFLKHPLTAMALPPDDMRAAVYLLDQVALRGPRPRAGLDGLRQTLLALDEQRVGDRQRLLTWLEKLAADMRDFAHLMAQRGTVDFMQLLSAHIDLAERLAATVDQPGKARVWRGEGGEAASLFLSDLRASAADIPPLLPAQYVTVLTTLLKGVTVRPRYGSHPRLFIYGLIEARLASADRMILGGLNEGTWPALPAHDPWLSRPMRKSFGLPSPEKELAQTAHDFVQAASRGEVFITRARKVDGTPTVPARWLMRMETVLQAVGLDWDHAAARHYRHWLRALDEAGTVTPVTRPMPAPPVAARPRKLSVTQIETWMRDPYQIYARYVLGLSPLDPIDDDPGGSERGVFIHKALEVFVRGHMHDIPDNAVELLLEYGRAALDEQAIPPEVEAFWWPRFEKIAAAFVDVERAWRTAGGQPYGLEKRGELHWDDFTLVGKADRIDRMADGSYAIIDYKTGTLPKPAEVTDGLSPQLPLEALMLQQGAFPDLSAGATSVMAYWRTVGTGKAPIEQKQINDSGKDKISAADLVEQAALGLRNLIDIYDDAQTPYISQPRPDAKPKGHDYDHLARIKEWGVSGDDDAEDAA